MKMIRLTDAINAVEDHFKARDEDFWRDKATKKDADLMCQHILERLINAEHVELDSHHLEMLRRLGLWSEIPYIIFKASKENNRTIQDIWADQHKYKYTTSGDTK